MSDFTQMPLVSVIVPTKNSAKFLCDCLVSLKQQTYPRIEIIVVDNHSDDGTLSIAAEYADITLTAGDERSAQVNAGAAAAHGKYYYRVDSDFVIEPMVIEDCVRTCESGYDAIAVHNDSDSSVSYWAKVRNFERRMYKNDELIVGARFFRADAFNAIGGFDEHLIAGEDYDIHNRLLRKGFKIGRIASGERHLGEPRSLKEIAEKSWIYGKQLTAFLDKNRDRGVKQLNPLRAAYLRNWKRFLSEPTTALGFILMQAVKYTVGGTAFLVRRLEERLAR